jgi:predicted PurR-regulated permease PerM
LLLVLVFVIPAYFIVPALAAQAPQLASSVVDGLAQLDKAVDWSRLPGNIKGVSDLAQQAFGALGGGGALTGGLGLVRRVGDVATGAVLLLVILFFYFKDGRRMWLGVLGLLPARLQPETDLLAEESFWTIGAFLRGQLLVALVDAVFIGLGLWILGVPLVLPLAVLVFFGGLFPIVGAFLSGTVAVVVALASKGLGTALLALAVVLLVQQLEGHVLSPLIQARNIALHPLVIILAVTTGAAVMGILGAFLGVPVAAVIARIVDHLQGREPAAGPAALRRRMGRGPSLDPVPAAEAEAEAEAPGDGGRAS